MNMKKLMLLLVGVILSVAPTFAQFSNTGGSSLSSGGSLVKDCNPYDRIGIEYLNRSYGDADMSTNGVGIYYLHGISLSKDLPFFLEIGAKLDAGFWNDTYYDEWDCSYESKFSTMSLSVPVNIAYKFSFNNGDVSIVPFWGLNFKGNLMAKMKFKYDDGDEYFDEGEEEETINFFNKDDVEKTWKRFQFGWHIGAGINYKQFYFGLSYGTDFVKIAKKVNTGTFAVGIGMNI